MVKSFAQKTVTGLRYDATGSRFIQNCKTLGVCLQASAILPEDPVVFANFKLK